MITHDYLLEQMSHQIQEERIKAAAEARLARCLAVLRRGRGRAK